MTTDEASGQVPVAPGGARRDRVLHAGPALPPWAWGLLPVALALLAMHGAFSLTQVFFVRDLAAYWWPMHLSGREALLAGQFPLWDPYLAYGQTAIGDSCRHILFPPAILLRLLPPVVGFNLWVALPFPLAALGAFLFLARHSSRPAAALGAVVFVLSGPVLSTGNMINNAWAVSLIPWILLSVDRLAAQASARRIAVLASAFALELLAAEPVTLVASAALAVAYAALGATVAPLGWRARARLALQTVAAGLAGLLLSAAQAFPLAATVGRVVGAGGWGDRGSAYWSLHPLTLVEAVAPSLFGQWLSTDPYVTLWASPLNDNAFPYLLSVYVGMGVVMLSLLGATRAPRQRWALFWSAAFAVGLLCALGYHTPLYPGIQALVPPLRTFRYPVKYLYLVALALAALTAVGWDVYARMAQDDLSRRKLALPIGVGLSVAGVFAVALLAPAGATIDAFAGLASAVGVQDPQRGAAFLLLSCAGVGPGLILLAAILATCLWIGASGRSLAPAARAALFAVVALDLLVTNGGLNPTLDAASLGEPPWVIHTREHPGERVYVSTGRVPGGDPETPRALKVPSDVRIVAYTAVRNVMHLTSASAWQVRDSISVDLLDIWPREYKTMLERFGRSDQDARRRFLERSGVRYFLTARPPREEAHVLTTLVNFEPTALYEGAPPAPRASLVPNATVVPDVDEQIERMFAADFDPTSAVLIDRESPAPAGESGPATGPFVTIVGDEQAAVRVDAQVPEGGAYLVLLDSYDPNWSVEVDGAPAPVLRANGLFRAVRLAPGRHAVSFAYASPALLVGSIVSAATALALLGACARRPRRAHAPER